MEVLLVSVKSDKIGLRVSEQEGSEDQPQQVMGETLAQTPNDCCSLHMEYTQPCYV